MRPFQDLVVWRKSHELTLEVYAVTGRFPKHELYGIVSQMRRSASSIPANIAEGSARTGQREFRQFLVVALGSAAELEYHLILARDLGYLPTDQQSLLDSRLSEVKRMLVTFVARLSDNVPPSQRTTNS